MAEIDSVECVAGAGFCAIYRNHQRNGWPGASSLSLSVDGEVHVLFTQLHQSREVDANVAEVFEGELHTTG